MSGEMCTSLGNGFTNLMLALFVCHEHGFDYRKGEVDGFVEGDDGIFALSGELKTEYFNHCGFDIKIKEENDPLTASFCGLIFSENGETIREPRRVLQTFGWTGNFIHAGDKILNELLRAKALSSAYETPQCPIVRVLADVALANTRHVSPRFVSDGFHDTTSIPRDEGALPAFSPSVETRQLFANQFKIPIETQLTIESLILNQQFDQIQHYIFPGVEQNLDLVSRGRRCGLPGALLLGERYVMPG